MRNIFAVLLNYNDGEDIVRSVDKLSRFSSVKKIVVVDNSSTDRSIELVKKMQNSKVVIIYNHNNFGFAKGCNVGIKKALKMGADGIANLNPDLNYSSDFIGKLAEYDIDLITPILRFRRGGHYIYDYGGKINWPLGKTYHLESSSKKNPFIGITPDFASGGAVLIKKEVFEKIGYFDERFFIYFEDADFSLRARQAGFQIATAPNVVIDHNLEIVKNSKNWQKAKNSLVANWQFIGKCIPWYFKPTAYGYLFLVVLKIIYNLIFAGSSTKK